MCSESLITSPRISFSRDLQDDDDDKGGVLEHMEVDLKDSSLMDVSSIADRDHGQEFDFSFGDSFTFQPSSSSAAELFSDGQIRPQQLEEKFVTTSKHTSILPPVSHHPSTNDHHSSNPPFSKETNIATTTTDSTTTSDVIESSEQKNQTNNKSFWKINRSSSVHCDNRKSSFWSLPLMLRSNSTGSLPSPRQISKENRKQNLQKQMKNSNSSASTSSFYMYRLSQKPPLKKNSGGSYGNGVWINPVLNVPPPYIAKGTANLFGITSLFKDKKDRKTKK